MIKRLHRIERGELSEEDYIEFLSPYIDALQIFMTRLEMLNKDFRRKYQNYPIHNIQHRIKKKQSIQDKLIRKKLPIDIEQAKENLQDIVGIRVICYFIDDIFRIVSMVKKQSDLVIIKEHDYINHPKPNGYRSYHIVFGVPIYSTESMEYFPVEIQFRTMSMDFWASMEHRVCYKKHPSNKKQLEEEFLEYAQQLKRIESNIEKYCERL